jgi:hypothetical protein
VSPAFAGKRKTLYAREAVSIGALTAKAGNVFIGEVDSAVPGDPPSAVIKVAEVLKGEPWTEVELQIDDPDKLPSGTFLGFAMAGKNGTWILLGSEEFGAIPLTPQNEAAFRGAVSVHLDAKNPKARATALMAAFRGNVARLRSDAVVDLWRESALLAHVAGADRDALTAVLADKALRCAFNGELPCLIEVTGRVGGDKAFESLASFLRERESLVYAHYVVRGFGALDRAYLTGPLLQRFGQEKDTTALAGQITVLAGLKVVQAFNRIASHASHADATVRKFAILGLGDLGGTPSVAALRGVLEGDGRPLIERKLAVVALAGTGQPDGIRLICSTEETSDDPALKSFIHTFRRYPARTRILLLRSALSKK